MPNLPDGQKMLLQSKKVFTEPGYQAIFPVIECFAFFYYFLVIPLAYETRYINKLFLISLQLFDYTVSRIQYFRCNKTPESDRRCKILSLLLAGESLCQFWSLGGRKPCF